MKLYILYLVKPFLRQILFFVVRSVINLFASENEELKIELKNLNFHLALCTHPSIILGCRINDDIKKCSCLHSKLKILAKCIRFGLLKDNAGHSLLKKVGINPCYGNGVELWFEESHTPIIPYTIPESQNTNCRKVIYTVITGNYDSVNEPLYQEADVDYILFTNNHNIRSCKWKIVYVESELDNVLLSREIKMLPHKYIDEKYDVSIYIDANAIIYGELSRLANYLAKDVTFAVSKHGERRCVKQEIESIGRQIKNIDIERLRDQYNNYLKEGFHDDMGLAECSILVRSHKDKKLQNLMEMWWNEFCNGVRRDQVSLLPCIQRTNFNDYTFMDGYVRHNQFCRIISHK